MKKLWWSVVALALAGLPARADVVVLTNGSEVQGTATESGDWVVVRGRHGEVRLPRREVAAIKLDAATRAKEEPARAVVAPDRALVWETNPEAAARLAVASNKLLLTFVVVGDLDTGRC